MAATREQAMTALLAVLNACGSFKLVSRRNRSPESIPLAQCPAAFLLSESDEYEDRAPLPQVRALMVSAVFYNDVGTDQNAIPSVVINQALDALDAALAPMGPSGFFTLGGLVDSVKIVGRIERVDGAKTGRSMASVPIKITLP
jgi:hypothetical protein